jgi:hypothetical protein
MLALTFMRPVLFAVFPIFVLLYFALFNAKNTVSTFFVTGAVLLMWLISALYLFELNLSNNFLSFYFILPVVFIFFSKVKSDDRGYLSFFMRVVTWILAANNLIALYQLYKNPGDDDSFNGFYGTHGLGLHTLSLVNFIVAVYHYFSYEQKKTYSNLALAGFFLISAVLCFYGLGLVVFILSIFIFKFSLRTFFKSIFIFAFVVGILSASLFYLRPQTFRYNYENIRRIGLFLDPNANPKLVSRIPRKLLMYKNYTLAYPSDPILFLTGSGPGTFNSRSYFLLNGEYSRSKFLQNMLGVHNPQYARKYIYPLWNKKNTGQYLDGTRNEPFSSVIAMLAEYGFLVTFIIFILVYLKYSKLLKRLRQRPDDSRSKLNHNFVRFVTGFMALNLFTDNFLEYPEIIIIYLIIFKTIESFAYGLTDESLSAQS